MILTELECSGRYRVVRPIDEGAVTTVYEAELLGVRGFSKRVALNVLRRELADDASFLAAFVSETKRSANLMHGNIVQIYQLGEVEGDYFVATELVRGPTVRQLIDRHRGRGRPAPPPLAAYIVSRVCRALDYAHMFVDAFGHRLEIVHGDVRPSDVLMTWDGHIKLANFGTARASRAAEGGAPPDAPADVYALGLVLYELLALELPHPEGDTHAPANSLTDPALPEFGHLLPGLDATLEYILRRALDHDAGRRPTAAVFGADLDRWIATQLTYGSPDRLQSHLAQLFPHDFISTTWTEPLARDLAFTALERAVRHNSNGRAGLLERWFGP